MKSWHIVVEVVLFVVGLFLGAAVLIAFLAAAGVALIGFAVLLGLGA